MRCYHKFCIGICLNRCNQMFEQRKKYQQSNEILYNALYLLRFTFRPLQNDAKNYEQKTEWHFTGTRREKIMSIELQKKNCVKASSDPQLQTFRQKYTTLSDFNFHSSSVSLALDVVFFLPVFKTSNTFLCTFLFSSSFHSFAVLLRGIFFPLQFIL